LNAQTSRLYSAELIASALSRFGGVSTYPKHPSPMKEPPADFERERLDFERKILERDKRIFELEKQVEELRREIERRRPAASLSSALSEVK
jgi:D-serine deaminase-like pyridoxal phosphate-dependent protein